MQVPGTEGSSRGSHRHMRKATSDQRWEARQLMTSSLSLASEGSYLTLNSPEAHLIGRYCPQSPAQPSMSCT